jgi:hypothetical protein
MYDAVTGANNIANFGLSIPRGTALPRRLYPVRHLGVPMIQKLYQAEYQNVLLRHPLRNYIAYLDPRSGSGMTVQARSAAMLLSEDTTIPSGDTSYDGLDLVVDACTLILSGPHAFNSLWVINGGTITTPPALSGQPTSPLDLTIAAEMIIDSSSQVDLSGHGFGAGQGPGHGDYFPRGAGAGYGGIGGGIGELPGGMIYGSPADPFEPGSGGGGDVEGGAGGGALRLVAGDLQLEGSLLANGLNGDYGAGGGSGGCINLRVGNLSGTGLIQANGGGAGFEESGGGGGGGGGRIAVRYGTESFLGNLGAEGGLGIGLGEAGSVYLQQIILAPLLVADYWHGEGIRMSWSPSEAGVVLEASAALSSDEAAWETIPPSLYETAGDMISYFEPFRSSGLKFFRLRWP